MKRYVSLAFVCLAVFAVMSSSAEAVILDLTTVDSWGTINGGIFQQYSDTGAGSGNIDSFVRIQSTGVQQGYNTDYRGEGFPEFDENTSLIFTHSVLLSNVPIVSNGGTDYREFMLDINQSGEPMLSVDKLEIALHATGDLFGYSTIFSSPIYDLDAGEDNWITLDYSLNSGSGQGDMLAFIPDSLFVGSEDQYVYLYSRFGENTAADDGFEEWAHGVDGAIIPEPGTLLLLGLGGFIVARKRSKRRF